MCTADWHRPILFHKATTANIPQKSITTRDGLQTVKRKSRQSAEILTKTARMLGIFASYQRGTWMVGPRYLLSSGGLRPQVWVLVIDLAISERNVPL
jgi:hypothetical protein